MPNKIKKYLPTIIAVVIIGLGIGAYSISRSQKQVGTNTQTQSGKITETGKNEGSGFVGSLKDALQSGAAMKCSWKDDTGNFSETHIKANRVHHKMVNEGRTGYMIAKDKCVWSWSDESDQGIKICYEENVIEDGELPTEGGINTQGYEFNCVPSVVADSVFEAPNNISFLDPMNSIPEGISVDVPVM